MLLLEAPAVKPAMREVKVKVPTRLHEELMRAKLSKRSYSDTVSAALEEHFERQRRLACFERSLRGPEA